MSGADFGLALDDPRRNAVRYAAGDDLASLSALARTEGLRVLAVDLQDCRDKRTLLLRLSVQLDFPPGFGRNWDALADALRDFGWRPSETGYALLLADAGGLREAAPNDFATLLDILVDTAAWWGEQDVPFNVFIALPDDMLDALADTADGEG